MSIQAKFHHLQAIQNLLAPYRYLYCVDLEATCDEVDESESTRPLIVTPEQMETIEIGLVVVDLESLEIVDEFQRFVRPQINPTLTDFCKKLTSIQQADVDGARTYREVGDELRMFAVRYPNAAWTSWGDYDARQLERDAGFAGCPSLLEGLPHFNARKWHAGLYDDRPKSLKQTVESLGLVWQGTYHRGIDDARNVASIVKEMLS
ncbi:MULTISPECIES: 3'-5' exonuclease [unclassified Pseudomonas]|uniref:3'-5' exonuclease n=1 Tax=unclassified Pseudomonas TaxID=196821 RepID=UPI000C86AC99|nr:MULTISPECIES: 3'-5' exonuclease [unclassified Pseudomonas]PMU25268.1 exonuclease [Pseudomonas sp. GP01-A9]PMU29712.1 exonuclease [Pseudomonas sp. GP01-A13]PMU40819.1 exonuclease [Pseudomonas sp. GP01-A8]PMU49536.1 exonuclease [Pseudomonas sp. GP01-A14]PMU54192.1 exonuclease [Pseudomonas sp. GP01-A6]